MAEALIGTLRIRTQEQKQIALMLATGFFMGVFIATYQVTADSLFLNRLGEQLNQAFLIAGALGIITTAIFSFFQDRIKFTTLTLFSVLLTFVFTLGAYLLLHFAPVRFAGDAEIGSLVESLITAAQAQHLIAQAGT